jgi:hypothetical protein
MTSNKTIENEDSNELQSKIISWKEKVIDSRKKMDEIIASILSCNSHHIITIPVMSMKMLFQHIDILSVAPTILKLFGQIRQLIINRPSFEQFQTTLLNEYGIFSRRRTLYTRKHIIDYPLCYSLNYKKKTRLIVVEISPLPFGRR